MARNSGGRNSGGRNSGGTSRSSNTNRNSGTKDVVVNKIINSTAQKFGYPPESLLAGSRREDFVELRAVIATAASILGIPLIRVSRVLGYKSHSAIYNLLRKSEERRIKREAEDIAGAIRDICKWTEDKHKGTDMWRTECGSTFAWIESSKSLSDSKARFCFGCGRLIELATAEESSKEN